MRGSSTSCGSWPRCWVWRAMPRCSPNGTNVRSTNCPKDLVRGPVWERLVDGAKRHYASGLRRSLIAMRSQRYFRLLDALEGLGGHRTAADPAGRGGPRPDDDRVGVQEDPQGGQGSGPGRGSRQGRGSASNSQGRQEASLHRRCDRGRRRVLSRQDDPVAAGRSPGQRGEPHPPERAGRGPHTPRAKTPSPTACSTSWRTNWRVAHASNSRLR